MKMFRYVASSLMLTDGLLHILAVFGSLPGFMTIPMLVYGVVYLFIGILLFLNIRFSSLLGIILPLSGLISGLFMIDPGNPGVMMVVLGLLDISAMTCCLFLLLKKGVKNV
jgi:hypothetical protein